jgi:peptide/nickel transport system substrate-binding protein
VIYPEGEVEKQGGAITKPVGTGPYEFVEWKKDAYMRMKKFKDYVADTRPASGLAGKKVAIVETVDFIPIPDGSVRAAAIERGDVDIAIELNAEDVPRLRGKPGVVVRSVPGIAFDDIRFGFKTGPFKTNQKLRQAVAYAIDKEEMSKANTDGQGKPVAAGFPVGMPFYGPVHAQDPYAKANVQRAKQLLQEAGYTGEKIVLVAHLVPDRIAQGAVIIQAQLQAIGMNIEVKTLESAALTEVWLKGEWAMFYSGLTPRPDADVYYCQSNESTSSNAGYNNPEYDRLCQEGRKALKAEDRARIYAQLEQVRRTDLPYHPTIYVPQVAAWRENVKGWTHWAAGYARVWGVSK